MVFRWPIEIDGLPFLIAWWIFPWRTVSHNQMVMVDDVDGESWWVLRIWQWLSVCYGIDGPWIWHQKSSRNHPSGSWPRSHLPSPPSTRETSGWSQWIRKMATESRGNDGKVGNLWKMGWKWDENRMKMGWKWDERWSKGKFIAS